MRNYNEKLKRQLMAKATALMESEHCVSKPTDGEVETAITIVSETGSYYPSGMSSHPLYRPDQVQHARAVLATHHQFVTAAGQPDLRKWLEVKQRRQTVLSELVNELEQYTGTAGVASEGDLVALWQRAKETIRQESVASCGANNETVLKAAFPEDYAQIMVFDNILQHYQHRAVAKASMTGANESSAITKGGQHAQSQLALLDQLSEDLATFSSDSRVKNIGRAAKASDARQAQRGRDTWRRWRGR